MADAKVAKLLAQWGEYVDEITRLRAENERFLEALKKIRDMDYRGYPHQSARIAREALEATDDE